MPVKLIGSHPEKMAVNPDSRAMTKVELEAAHAAFQSNFSFSSQHNPLKSLTQSFLWSELARLIQRAPDIRYPGLAVHHGLYADNLRYAFRVFSMRPRLDANGIFTGVYEYDPYGTNNDPMYLLDDSDFYLIDSPSEVQAWRNMEARYVAEVKLRLNTGGWTDLDPLRDPQIVTFPWIDELVQLYANNCPNLMDTRKVVVRPVSTLFNGNDGGRSGYRHGVCFHMEKGNPWTEQLGVEDSVLPFRNQGADFGNLCPPSCDTYTAPAT